MPPLVSVVIPYYNQPQFLRGAVESVLAQTYARLEIVVVDDASGGPSVEELLRGLPCGCVTIAHHQENEGPAAARNTGFARSRGAFFLPLDADDCLEPDYLSMTVPPLVYDDGVSAVVTAVRTFGESETVWTSRLSYAHILTVGSPNTFLMRKSLFDSLGGYNVRLRQGENSDLLLRAIEAGFRLVGLPEPLYRYRKHAQAQTRTSNFAAARAAALVAENHDAIAARLDEIMHEQTQIVAEQVELYRQLVSAYAEIYALHQGGFAPGGMAPQAVIQRAGG